MSFKTRLLWIVKYSGKNVTSFGSDFKSITVEGIRRHTKVEDANPTLAFLVEIMELYPMIQPRWLLMEKGPKLLDQPAEDFPEVSQESSSALRLLIEKSEECGALKRELEIVKLENEILRAGGSGQEQQIPDARAG